MADYVEGAGLYRPSWQHTNMYQPMAMYELLEEIEMSFDKSECTRYCRMRSAYIVWIQGGLLEGGLWARRNVKRMQAKLIAEQANKESQI